MKSMILGLMVFVFGAPHAAAQKVDIMDVLAAELKNTIDGYDDPRDTAKPKAVNYDDADEVVRHLIAQLQEIEASKKLVAAMPQAPEPKKAVEPARSPALKPVKSDNANKKAQTALANVSDDKPVKKIKIVEAPIIELDDGPVIELDDVAPSNISVR